RFSRDWSSDVCSSDLTCYQSLCLGLLLMTSPGSDGMLKLKTPWGNCARNYCPALWRYWFILVDILPPLSLYLKWGILKAKALRRSEERRVGKECRCR